jgi:hypothetical protein
MDLIFPTKIFLTKLICSTSILWVVQMESHLNNLLIDRFSADETAGYPTLCKCRFITDESQSTFHVQEEPQLN